MPRKAQINYSYINNSLYSASCPYLAHYTTITDGDGDDTLPTDFGHALQAGGLDAVQEAILGDQQISHGKPVKGVLGGVVRILVLTGHQVQLGVLRLKFKSFQTEQAMGSTEEIIF